METMEFSTGLKKQSVTIDGESYEIREMSFEARSRYLDALSKTMTVKMVGSGAKDEKGQEVMRKEITINSLSGAQASLLTNTLFLIKDGTSVPVSLKTVQSWGSKLVEQLAKIASDLNGLEQPDAVLEEAAEKN